jgi:hypothetical protein
MSTFRWLVFSFLISMMWSCSVDEFDTTEEEVEVIVPTVTYINNIMAKASNNAGQDGLVLECITVVFPFSMIASDSTVYEIVNENSFEFINASVNIQLVDFIYPLTLIDRLGEASTVADITEFSEVFAACVPIISYGSDYFGAYVISTQNSCYELVYPLQIINFETNEVVSTDNEQDFINLLAADYYVFDFPITLQKNNELINIDSPDYLFYVLAGCSGFSIDTTDFSWGSDFQYLGCYEIVFPITLEVSDSDSIVIVSNAQVLGDYYLHGKVLSYVFPLQLLNEFGEIFTVNSEEELNQYLDDCYLFPNNFSFILLLQGTSIFNEEACYDLIYPFQLTDSLTVVNITSEQQLIDDLEQNNGSYLVYELVYPVSISVIESQTTVVLNTFEDIVAVLTLCN